MHVSRYMHPAATCLVGGILPFGAIFIELFFILSSIWLHQFYYLFGFLALVFIILVVTCAEITIVLAYFQLCAEDYRWCAAMLLIFGCAAVFLSGWLPWLTSSCARRTTAGAFALLVLLRPVFHYLHVAWRCAFLYLVLDLVVASSTVCRRVTRPGAAASCRLSSA